MPEINNGGPAFPMQEPQAIHAAAMAAVAGISDAEERDRAYMEARGKAVGGMTLRDYFAAKARQGIVSSIDGEANYQRLRGHATEAGLSVSEWIARDAYKQADAMLNARRGNHG